MKDRRRFVFSASLLALGGLIPLSFGEESPALRFAAEARQRIAEKPSVAGDEEGWLFLVRELRHLGTGNFWEQPWEEVAVNGTDPVPSMVEFQAMLAERGVKLVLVPVPAKARIYPEKLDRDFAPGDAASLTPFVERLRAEGLTVVDLDARFRAGRGPEGGEELRWYCAQDAHFSPTAIRVLAEQILSEAGIAHSGDEAIRELPEVTLSITGDQVVGSEWEGKLAPEVLKVEPVGRDGVPGVAPDPESPFLLLGDSHTLVFHEGSAAGMHCRGAGLLDRLSFHAGRAFDLVGVRGSGLVQARKQLYFRATAAPGFWARKKLVVWVFSEREFTQSRDRILPIPLDR